MRTPLKMASCICVDRGARVFRRITTLLALILTLVSCQMRASEPGSRYGAMMVFDPIGGQALLFGGRARGLVGLRYFNDLWAFDSIAQSWTPVRTNHRPPPRLRPGMVYDPIHHQIIMFGGHAKKGRLGDTWIYDIANHQWEEVTPANSPPARSDGGMAYDAENELVVLFSGYCQDYERDLCNDTWHYDPETTSWIAVNPTTSPPLMYGQTLVYDAAHQVFVLWGGHASRYENGQFVSNWYEDDIWIYDAAKTTWRPIETTRGPAARYWHHAAFDEAGGQQILFGGNGSRGFLNDTWFFDTTRHSWRSVRTEDAPSPRINAAMVYDSLNNVTILSGGLSEDVEDLGDTWVLQASESETTWVRVQ